MFYSDLFIVSVLVGIYLFRKADYWHQKILWNSGICHSNSIPWKFVELSPFGGRVYKAGHFQCIISSKKIDKNRWKKNKWKHNEAD